MIKSNSIEEIRREIDRTRARNSSEEIIVVGRDIEFNRKVLENKKVNALLLNHRFGKDKLRERDSGLNHVLCGIAKKNGICFMIDFSEFSLRDKKESAVVLSRIAQNLKLLRKYKNKVKIITAYNDRLSVQALLRVLGLDSKTAKDLAC